MAGTLKSKLNAAFSEYMAETSARVWKRFERLQEYCESPIEQLLALEFVFFEDECGDVLTAPPTVTDEEIDIYLRIDSVIIVPQRPSLSYRPDFTLFTDRGKIFVECDGHDFHEKTKEQAARDKARDRALTSDKSRVIRYTGSEIWANAAACANNAIEIAVGVPPQARAAVG